MKLIPFKDVYNNDKPVYCKDLSKVQFRPSAYALIKNSKGKILMIRDGRCKHVQWELPGGGLEVGESPQQAAKREVREEVGYTITCKQLLFTETTYMFRKNTFSQCLIFVFEARLLSKKQHRQKLAEKNEICEAHWFSPKEIRKLPIADMHKKILKIIK